MRPTPRILQRAQADVDAIFDWLVSRSIQGAVSWYLTFHQAVDQIAAAPESFPEAPEAQRLARPIRQALFRTRRGRTYRIVFEFSETETLIFALEDRDNLLWAVETCDNQLCGIARVPISAKALATGGQR